MTSNPNAPKSIYCKKTIQITIKMYKFLLVSGWVERERERDAKKQFNVSTSA
jgi:hypothetical protein